VGRIEVSVAMCTFNGAAYLADQLQSMASQERLPDELVVCDDGSTDGTPAALRAFAAAAPFEVRLTINARNLGSTANFAQAVSLCRGEIIFLADQDDVWMPDKVRRMAELLKRGPHAGPAVAFALSDARLIDAQGRPLRPTLWQALPFPPADQARFNAGHAFDILLRRNVATGMTMAFRAEHRDVLLPIPSGWVHDGWFALLLAALGPGRAVAEPLVHYRQHDAQQIGGKPRSLRSKYRRRKREGLALYAATAENYAAALERLRPLVGRLPDPSVLDRLQRKVRLWQHRVRMRTAGTWRLPRIVCELLQGSYHRYASGWWSAIEDLIL